MGTAKFDRMERESGWSNKLLYQLVDSVTDYAIFAADLDGRIESWNIGADKIFGYTPQEAIGLSSDILFTPEDRANGIPEQERSTARETGCADDERWHLRKDGSRFFASGVQTALYDEEKNHVGYAKIARDLTERIELQGEIEAAHSSLETTANERTAGLANSNESLRVEVTNRKSSEETRVAMLRKIVASQEGERKRIAREIHDTIGQQMTVLQLKLSRMQTVFAGNTAITSQISEVQKIAGIIDSEVDFLAWELRPAVLDDLGLAPAIEKYVNEWSEHFRTPAEFRQVGLHGKKLLPEVEINLYRITQEAMNNTGKYAKATNVSVLLEHLDSTVSLIIEDNGVGFEPTKKAVLTGGDSGLGLLGMKERAELVGGNIDIESSPNTGTTVFVRVPATFYEEAV